MTWQRSAQQLPQMLRLPMEGCTEDGTAFAAAAGLNFATLHPITPYVIDCLLPQSKTPASKEAIAKSHSSVQEIKELEGSTEHSTLLTYKTPCRP